MDFVPAPHLAPSDLSRLRAHAIGCFVVGFVASVGTMLLAMMAKVGPQIFTYVTMFFALVTLVSVIAGIGLFIVMLFKRGVDA